jgi:glycosyltransferase involved in cell wall biosynthesis
MRLDLERKLEGMVLRRADRVIGTTEVVRGDFLKRYPYLRGKVGVIPNGFDRDDMERTSPVPRRSGDGLWVVHTGSFGYSHPHRSPSSLFRALRRWTENMPELTRYLRLMLVGALTEQEQNEAADLVARGVVEMVGPVHRDRALSYQSAADVLLLVDHPREGPASNVPRKFYEYLAMRKPILALVSEGATRDQMRELKAGIAVHPRDEAAIMDAFTTLVKRWRDGMLRSDVREETLARFEAPSLAAVLADGLNEIAGMQEGRPFHRD